MIQTVGLNGGPNWLSSTELALVDVSDRAEEVVVQKHLVADKKNNQLAVERIDSKSIQPMRKKHPSIETELGFEQDDNSVVVVVVAAAVVADCTKDVDGCRKEVEE
jgi:hypothetical protein